MKQFFKFFLAVVLGTLVSFFLIFILMFSVLAGIAAVASSGEKEVKIKDNTILVMTLKGPIVERAINDPFAEAFAALRDEASPIGLNVILKNIKKAKNDENIEGIYLEAGIIEAGYATVEEIRNALEDFKESGKFIVSFSPVYSQKAYYLASVADKIYLNPEGMLEFGGLFAEGVYLKGTLDKLGIDMQVVRHGKFKSAVEPFIRHNMSESARLQTEKYLYSMWDHVIKKVGEQRDLDEAALKAIADSAPVFRNPQELVDAGLIDGLKYKDEVIDELKSLTKTDEKKDLKSVSLGRYTKVPVQKKKKGFVKEKLAIIYAEGEIDGFSNDGIRSDELSKTIREARRDSSIKAIVFRVNSPGGSALGSEIIWREISLAQDVKPVVVSMGDVAASGGYYISCAAQTIVAEPVTLTGSIGVFGLMPNFKGLMDKIGVSFDGVKTNKFSDMPSVTRPFTKEERALMQGYVERTYQTFIAHCANGRHTTTEKIDEIGQGRVWSGENALVINLVDTLGGISDAIEIAKKEAGLEQYRIVELPEIPDPFEKFIKELTGNMKMFIGRSFLGDEYKYLRTYENLKNGYPVQARLPYDISVN